MLNLVNSWSLVAVVVESVVVPLDLLIRFLLHLPLMYLLLDLLLLLLVVRQMHVLNERRRTLFLLGQNRLARGLLLCNKFA